MKAKISANIEADQKMLCYLQQKIYCAVGNLYLKKNNPKEAFESFYKSLVNLAVIVIE